MVRFRSVVCRGRWRCCGRRFSTSTGSVEAAQRGAQRGVRWCCSPSSNFACRRPASPRPSARVEKVIACCRIVSETWRGVGLQPHLHLRLGTGAAGPRLDAVPPLPAAAPPAGTPPADDRVGGRCWPLPHTARRNAQIQQHIGPTNACTPWPKKTTNRGSDAVTMNCVPMMPARNPTRVFASPPMPITLLDSASCASPAKVPDNRPVAGPDVNAT